MIKTRSLSLVSEIFSNLPVLETQRLILRPMRSEDAQDMYEYASRPEASAYTIWDSHRSIDETRKFLACVEVNYARGEIENWGIEFEADGKFIGTCGFFFWDMPHRGAEIHYALSPDYSGRGLMTEAIQAVLRFGFERMGLHRIEAKCMVQNRASERVMQKAGMKFEGIMRDGIFAKGRYHDLKVYAVLEKEWEIDHR